MSFTCHRFFQSRAQLCYAGPPQWRLRAWALGVEFSIPEQPMEGLGDTHRLPDAVLAAWWLPERSLLRDSVSWYSSLQVISLSCHFDSEAKLVLIQCCLVPLSLLFSPPLLLACFSLLPPLIGSKISQSMNGREGGRLQDKEPTLSGGEFR